MKRAPTYLILFPGTNFLAGSHVFVTEAQRVGVLCTCVHVQIISFSDCISVVLAACRSSEILFMDLNLLTHSVLQIYY